MGFILFLILTCYVTLWQIEMRCRMRCNLNRIRDEGSAWIKLADAIAGFCWHAYKNKPYTQTLFPEMQQKGYLMQL